jgi:hypothetical protein
MLALAGLLVLAAAARSGSVDWSLMSAQNDPEWTNVDVNHAEFAYAKAGDKGNRSGRNAYLLSVTMPRQNAPHDRAMATITRTDIPVTEGDHVELTYFGQTEPAQDAPSPAPELVVFVKCLVPGLNGGTEEDWVEIGHKDVQDGTHSQTLTAKIKGKGCDEVVSLGKNRQITGLRIQLLGAKRKRDRQTRTVYLERFKLLNGGENTPVVDDDFAKQK